MALLGNFNPVPVHAVGHVLRVTVAQASLYRPAALQQAGLLVILVRLRVIGQGAGRERIFQLESATATITYNLDIIGAPARVDDITGFMITAIAIETSIITECIIPVTVYSAGTKRQSPSGCYIKVNVSLLGHIDLVPHFGCVVV